MAAYIDPTEWMALKGQAETGQLSLNAEVGRDLARVCDDHLAALDAILVQIRRVERISGFGSFNTSRILEQKFSQTAVGGDRALDATILQHIEAVTTAKEVVLKAIANFEAQDDYTAGQFNGIGGN
ncbi:hypothetical protein [Nocardia asteroides]|uniref:Uncharacterized protein n=1 Tax=Nocardia asteroides NBRC 15531 TaxID=1110697 RepID=U5EHN9_NOCAS|nr:hypothetical protein [Nocardia asteroides]TLF70298.1 hypothetical protein FEK33_08765 [Nocardia asteroides NBRC 15531]UGT49826.1 hypothetical protein LT345_04260 [Nocardia asteroides]SFM02197.1 hypothetical protein SAMN05444423_1011777 [Nocardia asteroides]VEG37424.1 Uncharacterised protein [Nocardia asteroides]BAO99001.1 hypothetical protein [Nocardia asteroides NBRC 15531]